MGRPVDPADFSIFVGDLGNEVDDEMLESFFANSYPSVRSANVIVDATTGRPKGFGFVRFGSEADRDRALAEMDGIVLGSRAVRVSPATARRNAAPNSGRVSESSGGSSRGLNGAATSNGGVSSISGGPWGPNASALPHPADFDPTNTTLFIGGLSALVTEEQLHKIFSKYGDIIYTKVPRDKGCGFVQFVDRAAAEFALVEMNGAVIGNAAIRISWGRSASKAAAAMLATGVAPGAAPGVGPGFPGFGPYGAASAGQFNAMQQYNMYIAAAAAHYGMVPPGAAAAFSGREVAAPGTAGGPVAFAPSSSSRGPTAGSGAIPTAAPGGGFPASAVNPYMAYGYAYAPYYGNFPPQPFSGDAKGMKGQQQATMLTAWPPRSGRDQPVVPRSGASSVLLASH